jgi:hypothetical protein
MPSAAHTKKLRDPIQDRLRQMESKTPSVNDSVPGRKLSAREKLLRLVLAKRIKQTQEFVIQGEYEPGFEVRDAEATTKGIEEIDRRRNTTQKLSIIQMYSRAKELQTNEPDNPFVLTYLFTAKRYESVYRSRISTVYDELKQSRIKQLTLAGKSTKQLMSEILAPFLRNPEKYKIRCEKDDNYNTWTLTITGPDEQKYGLAIHIEGTNLSIQEGIRTNDNSDWTRLKNSTESQQILDKLNRSLVKIRDLGKGSKFDLQNIIDAFS